jgi:hypothetical protein
MTFVDPSGRDMDIRGEGGFGRTAAIILLGLLVLALTALVWRWE